MVQSLDDARRRRSRIPPHNLEAEESLLGAMLLSRDAIVSAVEIQLGPDDFYRPAHGHIFDAITSLYAQGEPADPVTVAEELRRAGLLEPVGGQPALVALQANTPAIGNAGPYARIVEEHALLRKLIAVAGDIADMGYSVPEDVTAAIDQAESLVFDVAQRRVTDSLTSLRDLLERHLDHIEALYERGEDITGVPTGFIDLDQQLAGLQPSNLVIVGGRPGTGKALALDTPLPTPTGWTTMGAVQAGDELFDERGRPCKVTFATPILLGRPCYEVTFDDGSTLVADADHQWLAYDRPRLGRSRIVTTKVMADAGSSWYVPLTGALDCDEAAFAASAYGFGFCVGGGRVWMGATSSAPEVVGAPAATTTRPHVARHIPASYLRASVEQRQALLSGLLAATGTLSPRGSAELSLANGELARQARELACSLGHRPGPIREAVVAVADGTTNRVWRLSWDSLRAATRRRVMSIRPVASVPVRCITVDSPSELYLAGESMIPTHNTSFALGIVTHAALESRTPVLLFSLEMSHLELTQRMLCSEARVDATRMRNGRLLESDWPKIAHATGRLAEAPVFIDDNPRLTVMEIRAKARRLKSRSGLGLIVIDYLQLMTGRQNAENRQVEVSEISRGLKILARELQVPVIALSQLSRNLETRADKRPVLADLRESGCMPARTRILRADTGQEVTLGELVLTQDHPLVWSVDEHNRLVAARLIKAFASGVKPVFELRLASGQRVQATANHRFLSADGWTRLDALRPGSVLAIASRIPATVGSPRPTDHVLPGDRVGGAGWDRLVDIVPIGTEPVFDATVAGTHNFIANGVVAHNSLEQDADVVIFLYRDEVYNRDSPDRGTAEVIVAKHRNGPTGVTQLAFLDHYTRFANMARGV